MVKYMMGLEIVFCFRIDLDLSEYFVFLWIVILLIYSIINLLRLFVFKMCICF